MQSKREILQKALENINHPLSEITRRTTYRGHSPGVKPTTGIKLNLPKTSTMAAKMERVLADKSPEGRKRMKQMNNLVIGREEDGDKISLEFKTTASRERFRKMMNELSENVHLDEMKRSDEPFTVVAIQYNKVVGKAFGILHDELEDKIQSMKEDKKDVKIRVTSKSGKIVHTESVQLDEGSEIYFKFKNPMKAGAFMRRIMRDKLASEVDRYDAERSPEEIVQVIMHPNDYERYDIERLAKRYQGELREDVQLDETNFRFPQPGEDYGELAMSINDPDSLSGSGMSLAQGKKKSAEIQRKFEVLMRKHKRTKVGEVLDLLAKDGKILVHEDSDIKLIKRYLTKHKDNVRKVAHQMMIDLMQGDDYLAKKRIPVRDNVEDFRKYLEEPEEIVNFNFDNRSDAIAFNYQAKKQGLALRAKEFKSPQSRGQTAHLAVDTKKLKTIGPKLKKLAKKYMGRFSTTTVNDKNFEKMMREDVQLDENVQNQVKRMDRRAKEKLAKQLNDLDLSGYGDYEARIDNVHKFKPSDLKMAMEMMSESFSMSLDERAKVPTYVIDRKTKKIVHGPTDTADAKLYLNKQIQPRKFMIRQIRGAAKKVGDTV